MRKATWCVARNTSLHCSTPLSSVPPPSKEEAGPNSSAAPAVDRRPTVDALRRRASADDKVDDDVTARGLYARMSPPVGGGGNESDSTPWGPASEASSVSLDSPATLLRVWRCLYHS